MYWQLRITSLFVFSYTQFLPVNMMVGKGSNSALRGPWSLDGALNPRKVHAHSPNAMSAAKWVLVGGCLFEILKQSILYVLLLMRLLYYFWPSTPATYLPCATALSPICCHSPEPPLAPPGRDHFHSTSFSGIWLQAPSCQLSSLSLYFSDMN